MAQLLPEQTLVRSPEQALIEPEEIKTRFDGGKWRKLLLQLTRFGIVGGLNTALDLGLFNLLLWAFPTQNTLLVLAYNSLAYTIGALNSFVLNKYWTFQRRRATDVGEVLRFILTTVAGILCSDLILWLIGLFLTPVGGTNVLLNNLSKLLAVLGTASVSYLGMHLWVFVHKTDEQG